MSEIGNRLLEIGIVGRQAERRAIEPERFGQRTSFVVDVGHAADRGKILNSGLEDGLELALGAIEIAELDEGAAQRDAGREITRMEGEAGAARRHRVPMLPGAPVFLGKLRKRNRRRVLLDPASKVFNPWIVGHRTKIYGTVTLCVTVPVRNRLSVTVRRTV